MIICRDDGLVEQVQAAAAAVRAPVRRVRESAEVRQAWRGAPAVFVGADQAAWVAGLGLPSRRGVHVIGRSADEVMAWSVPLEAAVLVLPAQAGFISAVLDQGSVETSGTLVRVIGASGGVGTSTLAAGLAQVAARDAPAALVELARSGGGLDLLLGAEQAEGWRWDELAAATGHLGDLVPRLPQQLGVTLVSTGRQGHVPSSEAAIAVLRSMLRGHPVVVVDAGRGEQATGEHWSHTRTLLVVAADVRGVVAARALVAAQGWHDLEVVLRSGPGRTLPESDVLAALGIPVVGRIGHHPHLPRDLARGVPPASGRSRFVRECRAVLEAVRT
ncbi:septum site-determining protein Ssd [Propionibacteriaceae bacterium G1746]|uniref:septum site-determining protein Ssd n=1 Tax=Aestuariimicrobium sp. G57 TaxID=3418485 RepID=UPI003C170D59